MRGFQSKALGTRIMEPQLFEHQLGRYEAMVELLGHVAPPSAADG